MNLLLAIDDKEFYFNNAEITMNATDNAMSLVVRSIEEKIHPDHTTYYPKYTGPCCN